MIIILSQDNPPPCDINMISTRPLLTSYDLPVRSGTNSPTTNKQETSHPQQRHPQVPGQAIHRFRYDLFACSDYRAAGTCH